MSLERPPPFRRRRAGCTWPGGTGRRWAAEGCGSWTAGGVSSNAFTSARLSGDAASGKPCRGFSEIPRCNDSPLDSTICLGLDL